MLTLVCIILSDHSFSNSVHTCSSSLGRWAHPKNTVPFSLVFLLSNFFYRALLRFHTSNLYDRALTEDFPVPRNWRPGHNTEGRGLKYSHSLSRVACNSTDVTRVKGFWALGTLEPSSRSHLPRSQQAQSETRVRWHKLRLGLPQGAAHFILPALSRPLARRQRAARKRNGDARAPASGRA